MPLSRRQFVTQTLAACAVGVSARASEPVIVFAAASLTEVPQTLAANLTTAAPLRFSFAASSTLARQIEQGAPAQLFISADQAWMDYLAERGRIEAATRRVVAAQRVGRGAARRIATRSPRRRSHRHRRPGTCAGRPLCAGGADAARLV